MKTIFGWRKKTLSTNNIHRFSDTDHPSLGAEELAFQHPQRDPIYQVQGPGVLPIVHYRIAQPQKWNIQTVLLAGIPATIGNFDLNALTDINFRPFE